MLTIEQIENADMKMRSLAYAMALCTPIESVAVLRVFKERNFCMIS